MTAETTDIFISHHGIQGRKIAENFRDIFAENRLITESSHCFVGVTGKERQALMHKTIGAAKWFFFIATNESCKSPDAEAEIKVAQSEGVAIIPLLAYEVVPDDLPRQLRGIDAVDVKGNPADIFHAIQNIVRKKTQKAEDNTNIRIPQDHPDTESTQAESQAKSNDTVNSVLVAGLILGALYWLTKK